MVEKITTSSSSFLIKSWLWVIKSLKWCWFHSAHQQKIRKRTTWCQKNAGFWGVFLKPTSVTNLHGFVQNIYKTSTDKSSWRNLTLYCWIFFLNYISHISLAAWLHAITGNITLRWLMETKFPRNSFKSIFLKF